VTAAAEPDPDPARLVSDLIRGAWRTLAARAMAELRLADVLVEPATVEEVAERTGTHAPTLDRLLRTLAAIGLLTYGQGRFELTEAGARLRSDVPGSDWGAMMMMPSPWTLETWQHLPDAVRTGQPVFEDVHGESFWSYHRSHEEAGRIFDAAMARGAKDNEAVLLVVEELTQSEATTVVDVGGGTGRLLSQIVSQSPGLRGVLADQQAPVDQATDVFAAHGVEDRCEAVVCDFFESVPQGGDAYVLSNILHDWDDDQASTILERIHQASAPGAGVLVLETLLPDEENGVGPESAQVRLLDLMMLLSFGARERSLAQYAELLENAGFSDVRLVGGTGGTSQHLVVARRT
jgi:hypothetical protein